MPQSATGQDDVTGVLGGLHILLIEDQSLIALDTEAMLHELGATTVETMAGVGPALKWLDQNRPHAAVLDINLGATSSFAIAEKLSQQSIPFIFTTGYGEDAEVPRLFADVQIVAKPYSVEAMGKALSACLGIAENN
jgi:CheY-like chemotaxis protein